MLEAHARGGAVVVEVALSKLWEEREDFIPCGLIQGFPALLARVEALRAAAFSVDDLMGIKEHVEILHLTPFVTEYGLVIQQRLGCRQHFQFPKEQFCLPALQEHTVLWADAQVTVIPESTLADQNGGKIACCRLVWTTLSSVWADTRGPSSVPCRQQQALQSGARLDRS